MSGGIPVALAFSPNLNTHSPLRQHRIVYPKIVDPKFRALVLSGFVLLACSPSEQRDPLAVNPAGLVEQGTLRLSRGDASHAIASFRTALLQDSLNADAMAGLSRAYGLQEKVQLAAVYLRRASATAYDIGVAALDEGDNERAEAAFNHVLDLVPRHPLALIRLGEIADRRGDQGRAIELFERAAEANPGYAESFVRLGRQHVLQRNAEKARTAFERAIEANINSPGAYMGLGDLLSNEGRWAAAVEQYDKVLLINPHSQAAKEALKRARTALAQLSGVQDQSPHSRDR